MDEAEYSALVTSAELAHIGRLTTRSLAGVVQVLTRSGGRISLPSQDLVLDLKQLLLEADAPLTLGHRSERNWFHQRVDVNGRSDH